MAQAEADWLRREFERIAGGERISIDLVDEATVDAIMALTHPELEFHETEPFPSAGVYRGHAEVRGYLREFTGAFERFLMEIDDFVPGDGDRVVALVTNRVRGLGSGAEVELRSAWVFTIVDELVVRVQPFIEVDDAFAAAGIAR